MPARLVPLTTGVAPPIHLHRPVLLIGRHPECDVRLDLPQVSRRHCCVALAYDRLTIRDLGSRHGVWVNGRRVEEAQLHPGDEVAIAPLLFRLEDPNPVPPPAPAPPPPAQSPSPDVEDPDGDLVPLDDDLFPEP